MDTSFLVTFLSMHYYDLYCSRKHVWFNLKHVFMVVEECQSSTKTLLFGYVMWDILCLSEKYFTGNIVHWDDSESLKYCLIIAGSMNKVYRSIVLFCKGRSTHVYTCKLIMHKLESSDIWYQSTFDMKTWQQRDT